MVYFHIQPYVVNFYSVLTMVLVMNDIMFNHVHLDFFSIHFIDIVIIIIMSNVLKQCNMEKIVFLIVYFI